MNFIYDILVNFNDDLYDFYEWNLGDNVTHIRKIPLFKVSTETLEMLKNCNVKVDLDFLKKIENRTEKFTSRDVEKIVYSALFSDLNDVFALKFNEKGNNIKISKLLIDESEEVLDVVERCSEINIKLDVLKPKKINKSIIRKLKLKKKLNNLIPNYFSSYTGTVNVNFYFKQRIHIICISNIAAVQMEGVSRFFPVIGD